MKVLVVLIWLAVCSSAFANQEVYSGTLKSRQMLPWDEAKIEITKKIIENDVYLQLKINDKPVCFVERGRFYYTGGNSVSDAIRSHSNRYYDDFFRLLTDYLKYDLKTFADVQQQKGYNIFDRYSYLRRLSVTDKSSDECEAIIIPRNSQEPPPTKENSKIDPRTYSNFGVPFRLALEKNGAPEGPIIMLSRGMYKQDENIPERYIGRDNNITDIDIAAGDVRVHLQLSKSE